MSKYRNRPDRRVSRGVQQNICAVIGYITAFPDVNKVLMTFTENVVLNGTPMVQLITPAGSIAADLIAATLVTPNQVLLEFDDAVDGGSKFIYVRDGDIAIRSMTGGYASHEPRLILAP